MTDDFPLKKGTTLTTAVLGVPVGGLVQVWAGKPTLWRLVDIGGFSDAVGVGAVARTQISPGRYREVCLFDEATGTVVLQERHFLEAAADQGFQVGGRVFNAEPPSEVFGDPWEDLSTAVFHAAARAFERGELIVVEPGGWDDSDGRYCLIGAFHDGGIDQIVLETSPVPAGSEVWPATDEEQGQTISAPVSDDTLRGAGTLAIDAVHRWGVAPWDVTITYVVPPEAFTDHAPAPADSPTEER
ncbi:hypothetical protein ACFQNE_15070 [Gordonia phosphorivorans]|uniref:DUF4178 domain-containing protein n=1 Tax=Gordonia phosphorivorans TaxID=1056982 RepID=A0ABV6HAV6_9ACTN